MTGGADYHWRNADDALPHEGVACEARAADRDGRYRLPFPVTCLRGAWRNARWGNLIVVRIDQWRPWREPAP